jgi:hypothetical protein
MRTTIGGNRERAIPLYFAIGFRSQPYVALRDYRVLLVAVHRLDKFGSSNTHRGSFRIDSNAYDAFNPSSPRTCQPLSSPLGNGCPSRGWLSLSLIAIIVDREPHSTVARPHSQLSLTCLQFVNGILELGPSSTLVDTWERQVFGHHHVEFVAGLI